MTHAPANNGGLQRRPHPDIDGGWGWMVVFASFSIHIVTDGVTYTLGLFYNEFLKYFKSGSSETSWIASILVGVTLCSGPISSGFVNRYGCRRVTIAGTIIAGICLILSVFAENIYTLYITIGFGTGLGFGMIYLPAIVCVTVYFEKLRSLATGIAVCGSGFGTVVFAPLTNYLISTFKWQGACLCISGIVFFCAIFGWMFRPLRELDEGEELEENIQNNNVPNIKSNNSENLLSPDGHQQIIRSQSIGNEMLKNGENARENNARLVPSFSQPLLNDPMHHHGSGSKRLRTTSHSGSGHLDRPDVFYTGSTHNIATHHKSHTSVHSDVDKYGSMRQRNNGQETDSPSEICGCLPCSEETRQTVSKMLSFSLLKDPVFILFTVSNFLTSIGFNIPYVYIAARAEALDISSMNASYLIATIGAANTIGRIILGYISDKPWVNRLHIYNACLTICGIATALSAFCYEFYGLATYCTVFGFTIGAYVGLTSVILVDLLGLENLTNAFGLLLLFQGIASFIGPPIGGALFDMTQKYEPAFVLAGVAIALSGIILYFIPPLQRHLQEKEARETKKNSTMVPL